jgi:hypothetical protein
LRTVFQDRSSSYETLLNQANKTTLYNRRLQDIAILIYKALDNKSPQYINQLFELRVFNYNLRRIDMLTLLRLNTVTYGNNSLRYMGTVRLRGQFGSSMQYFGTESSSFDITVI